MPLRGTYYSRGSHPIGCMANHESYSPPLSICIISIASFLHLSGVITCPFLFRLRAESWSRANHDDRSILERSIQREAVGKKAIERQNQSATDTPIVQTQYRRVRKPDMSVAIRTDRDADQSYSAGECSASNQNMEIQSADGKHVHARERMLAARRSGMG